MISQHQGHYEPPLVTASGHNVLKEESEKDKYTKNDAQCDINILQLFTFKPQNHITQCTQQLQECVQKVANSTESKDRVI